MVRCGFLSFKDVGPNVKDNALPKHGGANDVNMVVGCPGDFWIFDIKLVRGDLVKMHDDLCKFSYLRMTMLVVVFAVQIYRVVTR